MLNFRGPRVACTTRTPFDKMGQEQVQQGIRKPRQASTPGWLGWANDWAVVGIALGTFVALVSIAVIAMIYAMSERRQLAEISTQTANRLNEIDRELEALDAGVGKILASSEASRPDFDKHVLDLLNANLKRALQNDDPILAIETAAAITRKARELKIEVSPREVAEIGLRFLTLVDDPSPSLVSTGPPAIQRERNLSDPAIEAVGELIGYRSSLLPSPLSHAQDDIVAHNAMLRVSKVHSFSPRDLESKIYGSMRALGTETRSTSAKIDLFNRPEAILTEDYRSLLIEGYDLKLDGMDLRNVVFSHCNIAYSGEPVLLDNVYFSNCTFEIARQGKDFASAALSATGQVGVIKR